MLANIGMVTCIAAGPSLLIYPVPAVYREHLSHSFSVTINDQSVPVLNHVGVKGYVEYAQCSLQGGASVAIEANEPIESFHITPAAAVSQVKSEGSHLHFAMAGPAYVVIQINRLNLLCLIADPMETDIPNPASPGVVDVAQHGIDSSGRTVVTRQLQAQIDGVSNAGGGTLCFAPGVYRTGTLNLKSGVSLYLASGAVMLGSNRPADYPITGTQVRKGSVRNSATLLRALHAHDIRIYGRGVIDVGTGKENFKGYLTGLNIIDCQRVRVDGLTEANCRGWTVFGFCQDVTISNFKSLQDTGHSTVDACDIVNCRKVKASHCLLVGGDDGFCVKACGTSGGMASTWGYRESPGQPMVAADVTLSDSVIYSNAAALKIGMQAFADISRVVFKNIDIARTRWLAIDHEQGAGRFDDIEFCDVRVDEVASSMNYSGKPQPLSFTVTPINGSAAPAGGAVGKVLLKNVSFADGGMANSAINGAPGGWSFANIRCENLRIAGQLVTSANSGHIDVGAGAGSITFLP